MYGIVVVVVYQATLLQGILIVMWKMLSSELTGIFIAINVLDTITNFGQVHNNYGIRTYGVVPDMSLNIFKKHVW